MEKVTKMQALHSCIMDTDYTVEEALAIYSATIEEYKQYLISINIHLGSMKDVVNSKIKNKVELNKEERRYVANKVLSSKWFSNLK